MTLTVLVVDDEPLARERLEQMLGAMDGVDPVGGAGTGKQAIEQVAELSPDVVLMDIRMPVMDGLEAAHHLKQLEEPPAVVFCSAYDEHALAAFDASAIDYIVKPVRSERLTEALQKAKRLVTTSESELKPAQRTHICANMRGSLELVAISEIICLIAEHKYVTVVHSSGEVLIEEPLKDLEAEFAEYFIRIHRNALIGVTHIAALSKNPDGQPVIQLRGTERELEVSRRNLAAVRKTLRRL